MKRRHSRLERAGVREEGFDAASILLSLQQGEWSGETSEEEERPSTSSWGGNKQLRTHIKSVAPSTRSYVWRGPRSGAVGARPNNNAAALGESSHSHSSSDEEPETVREVAHKARDKEWAALTTWLRMNLHHPRTLKKLVLFVGEQDHASGRWAFDLNPGLSWHDVSLETKMRLKTLPQETETAFAHKYPSRPSSEWALKSQKYRAPDSSYTATVPLADMVNSLQDIYWRYEGFTCPQQEQAQQQQLAGAPPSLACSHPAEANNWQLAPPLRMPPPMPLRQPLMAAAGQQQATGQQQRSQGLGASACGDATPASMAAASHDPGSDSGADENCEMQLGH